MRPFLAALLSLSLVLALPGVARAEEPAPPAEPSLPVGPLLLGGVSLATLAVGLGVGRMADDEYEDFNADDDGTPPTNAQADDIETHALVANVLLFGGAALAAGSLLWWLLDDDDEDRPAAKVEVEARLAPNGGELVVTF